MEECVINEAKIQEDLEYLDKVIGLSEKDRKIARGDLIAGVDRNVIKKYLKKGVSQARKKLISSMLRAGADVSVVDKYLDKKINEEKINQALRYQAEGIPPLIIDSYFNNVAVFSRLLDYWLLEQSKLKKKSEEQTEKSEEKSDGLIRNTEAESAEISNCEKDKATHDSSDDTKVEEKDDSAENNPKCESVTEEKTDVESVEPHTVEEESKAVTEDKSVDVVPQNTVITNGFTFEQMMQLFSMMNNGSKEQSEDIADQTEKSKQSSQDILSEERIQAIVSAAMKQTIEEAKKQTLAEINLMKETKEPQNKNSENASDDFTIEDIRKEITELRREADENRKSENKFRSEIEEKNKETADRMKSYFDEMKKMNEKAEKTYTAEKAVPVNRSDDDRLAVSGYMTPMRNQSGSVVGMLPVEIERKKSSGIGGVIGLLGFKKKSQQSLVRMVISGELDKAQLGHIVGAMKKGLSEGQLTDLIESRVPAEKMPEIIEIALLEKRMGYAY